VSESVIPIITSVGGGLFVGLILGYFIKKAIKILLFITGGLVGLLLYLQQQQIVSINLDKLEQSTNSFFISRGSSFDNISQIGNTSSLGIPMAAGLSAGLAIGLMKG
jgi:uncharacterized membrane protein (Fun14 family)